MYFIEQAQNQDTYDEESGLELHDVLEQAGDEGVDLDAMEEGEIATFEAVSAYSARSTQQVTIEKGPLYRYADYNSWHLSDRAVLYQLRKRQSNCVLCTAS